MKKAIIIGARADGHAKVVLEILLAMKTFTVCGFVDDDPAKKGILIRGYPVLGGMNELQGLIKKLGIECGIAAIGHNEMRRNLSQQVENHGLELINAIHPTAHFDSDVQIGKGCYIGQGVIIVTGSKIGNNVNIHTGTTIDHDNVIEDGANIGPGTHSAGRVQIGKDAFLGTGTIVIPDISIGESAVSGAGTVIIRDVPAFTKVVGNPARTIGKK
ncbi:MAG: acetyltransferase [Bacteroidota bacterium]|nr:acetyltransferase [Bacteroidota bacterium]